MIEIEAIRAWYSAAMPGDWTWLFYAVRTVTFYSILLTVYFLWRFWRVMPSVWQFGPIIAFNIGLIIYYLDVLYLPNPDPLRATPKLVFFNLMLAGGYVAAFLVADKVRQLYEQAEGLERKRRRNILSRWEKRHGDGVDNS